MKVFIQEDGKEVVYIQNNDIMFLIHEITNISIPSSVINHFFSKGCFICDDSNRFDFVRFENSAEVEFFKKLEFILDYNQFKDFTDEQFQKKSDSINEEMDEIAEKFNNMSVAEKNQNQELRNEYTKKEYMCKFLYEIFLFKHKKRKMNIPGVKKKRFIFF